PVHVSHKYLRNLPNKKKRQKKPRGWLVTYIILSSMAFFYSKRLITATQLLLNATNLNYKR
ncbi:MAG: hypothetical protein O7177_03160, partial [Wolbachia endosymbiont of Andrena agilissima]|nr:hypothetical protein [Wolbachia endosymbiont of Andrena agilissima]